MASLDNQMSELLAALGANSQSQVEILNKQKTLSNANIESGKEMVQNALDVSAKKRQGDLEAQQRALKTAMELGNDINDPQSVLSIMVQDFRESSIKAHEQQKAIAEKQQVGFFDSPLDFLVNQVTLPDEINAAKATQGIADQSAQTVQNMQSLTTAAAQAAQATKQTMSKESIAQEAALQKAGIDDLLRKQQIDALGYDSAAYKVLGEANAQKASLLMQRHSAMLADAANARASEMHKAQMAKINEDRLEDQQVMQIVNTGARAFQKPELTLATIKMMQKSPGQRAVFEGLFDQGMATLATGSTAVGSTPGQAIINTLQVKGLQGPENKQARDFLERVTQDAIETYKIKGGTAATANTPQGKADIASLVNDSLFGPVDPKTGKRNERLGQEYKAALNSDSPTSIYKAAELPTLANLNSVKTNILYDAVIKPAVDAGVTSSSPDQMYKLAVAAKDRGLITDKQLVMGISDFYKSATAETYASKGLGKFGFPYRPSYVAELPSVFSTSSVNKDKIDFARPESVLSYHTAAQARLAYDSVYRFNQKGLDPRSAAFINQYVGEGN